MRNVSELSWSAIIAELKQTTSLEEVGEILIASIEFGTLHTRRIQLNSCLATYPNIVQIGRKAGPYKVTLYLVYQR